MFSYPQKQWIKFGITRPVDNFNRRQAPVYKSVGEFCYSQWWFIHNSQFISQVFF